jgi:acetyl-CoA carboxylase, biotin carboxylase subunit
MSDRVLIANRGEIAVRIIRACRELGVESVAIYSDPDQGSLAVRLADHSVRVGPAQASKSYLSVDAVIAAAVESGATAVHPGYGFLSENADFAQRVIDAGLVWIGPPPSCITLMGDKSSALAAARRAGVATLPSSPPLASLEDAQAHAEKLGFPLLLKANGGGGGRGIRFIADHEQLSEGFAQAQGEVGAAFADPSLYLEKFISPARHVEVQVMGDKYGNLIHLYERECSMQRRRQKLIEEAPAPNLPESTRKALCEQALQLAVAVDYDSVGTVEFLVDSAGTPYFIEMNTRVQVEHGVTELVTGIDIVREQIKIALGEKLSIVQEQVAITGAAIEIRINAEDPARNFAGSPGTLDLCRYPSGPGIRIDAGFETGDVIQPFYDSMIAKVLCLDSTRDAAVIRMQRALREFEVAGVSTTVPFTSELLVMTEFVSGAYDTETVETYAASKG